MAVGSGKRVTELEAENARLQQWIAHLQGTDAMTLAAQVQTTRTQLAELQQQLAVMQAAAADARAEERASRAQLAENLDEAAMHEVGLYTFNHRLDTAVAYKQMLTEAQVRMKAMVRAGAAIEASTTWSVNNSAAQGRKMVKDISSLMLRAYNAEADSLVRTLRPHSLVAAKSRLDKAAFAIERLGKLMSIRISPDYHRLRYYELELTADFLLKREQEKEAERERRAELRDQAKAAAEMRAALEKLSKEQAHYRNLLAKLDPSIDQEAWADAQAKLAEIDASISGVQQRAANIRTGHVYVISNLGAFGPDMVKIGMTRRLNPYDRVVELGDASVPFRFDVHAMVFHEDAVSLETALHQRLAERKVNRVNPRREFFYATPSEVRELLAEIAGARLVEYRERPEAIEWHASGSVARTTPAPAEDDDVSDALEDATGADLGERLADEDELAGGAVVVDDEPDDLSAGSADLDEQASVDSDDSRPSEAPRPDETGSIDGSTSNVESSATSSLPSDEPAMPSAMLEAAVPQPETPAFPMPTPMPAAGWFPDPHGLARLRYWDGAHWTGHTSS